MPAKILVTGANGQIGSSLVEELRQRHGREAVLATDIRQPENKPDGPFEILDVLDAAKLQQLLTDHPIEDIYHLAAVLSATGEQNPARAWQINMDGLLKVLEACRQHNCKVFFPSTIAVFGPEVERQDTPQLSPLHPTTVYGISKAAGENWCKYYFEKYGVDARSLRYPGIIGPGALPGGGTTDYAVEIYHYAVRGENYRCFLAEETRLPMMYMPDAIRATIELMEAPADQLSIRTSYNLAGTSFTPAEVTHSIRERLPAFSVSYAPDFRQKIAESWPQSIDDSQARQDWGWQPEYDLEAMTSDMLRSLQQQYAPAV